MDGSVLPQSPMVSNLTNLVSTYQKKKHKDPENFEEHIHVET